MTNSKKIFFDPEGELIDRLAKEILGADILVIETISLKLLENFETNLAKIEAKIIEIANEKVKKLTLQGEGVGLIDAYFDAMIKIYQKDFCSLLDISIVDFRMIAHVEHANHRKSDAKVTATLRAKNSDDHEYSFQCTTSSISHSSVLVVQTIIGFFLNAELAYKKLHFALLNAKERGRGDLVERFQNNMSTIVKATSYEKLVQKINQ